MRILIVDDDAYLLRQLKTVLEEQCYAVEIASDGKLALDILFDGAFDLIILDIMMPKVDGLSFLREIRGISVDVPVLMLSAKGDVDDKIKGLDLGADDFLAKPFSLGELMARVRALLRRKSNQNDSILRAGRLRLNSSTRIVTANGAAVDLTPREFAILEFLLYNKNCVVTRFSLAEHVWTEEFDPFSMSNFVDVHIKNLRRKISDIASARIIETVRGAGYMIRDTDK